MDSDDSQLKRYLPEYWHSEHWQAFRQTIAEEDFAEKCIATYCGGPPSEAWVTVRAELADGRSSGLVNNAWPGAENLGVGTLVASLRETVENSTIYARQIRQERFESSAFWSLNEDGKESVSVPRNDFRDLYECVDQEGVKATAREIAQRCGLAASVTAAVVTFTLPTAAE